DNITDRAAHLVLGDDPVESQRNPELARQCLPQLDLKTRGIARLARERHGIRAGTYPDGTAFTNRIERSRLNRPIQTDNGRPAGRKYCLHSLASNPERWLPLCDDCAPQVY